MSGDEQFLLIASGIVSVVIWTTWFLARHRIRRFSRPSHPRWLFDIGPLLAAAILFIVLRTMSAHDVRDDVSYIALYFFLGATWIGLMLRWLPLVGFSPRDDVMERWNSSAAYAITGALLAITLCFAGGNIGDGPGWWVVVFSAGIATLALFLVWLLLEAISRVSDVVTIDRDDAAGVRLGGFLVACGLIFGTAAAGDWVSTSDTIRSFVEVAWPALLLTAVAASVEWLGRPTVEVPRRSFSTFGVIPALSYVAAALFYVALRWPLA